MTATLIAPKDVETRLAVSRSPRAELAEREHNGLAVTLFWVRDTSLEYLDAAPEPEFVDV
jgi:hypothetical protein